MHEENFQKTYFGEHYGKLEAIKRKYDPRGLFVVISGVGSEEWDHDLNCRLKDPYGTFAQACFPPIFSSL